MGEDTKYDDAPDRYTDQKAGKEKLKATRLCSNSLVRRNLNFLFSEMAQAPCFDYFDRLRAKVSHAVTPADCLLPCCAAAEPSCQAQEPLEESREPLEKSREQCLKDGISALFWELHDTAGRSKDQERQLQVQGAAQRAAGEAVRGEDGGGVGHRHQGSGGQKGLDLSMHSRRDRTLITLMLQDATI